MTNYNKGNASSLSSVSSTSTTSIPSRSQFISITSNAWSNIAKKSVVNYMAVSPSKSIFLESVNTEEQGHDVVWLSQDMSRVISGIGEKRCGCYHR